MSSTSWSSLHARFFRLVVLCAAAACATSPPPKAPQPAPAGEATEIQKGRDVDRALSAGRRFYGDSALERYVHQVGTSLAAKSARPGLPWTFRVLDDPSLNAFAFPGGFVYVTRGMLAYLNSEAQLASVLAHEIAHVTAGHAVDRSTRLGITGAGLVVGTAGGTLAPTYGSMDRLQTLVLERSRHAEQEADTLGLRYMSDAGYDPTEMLAVLRTVEHAVGGPAWLASHPNPEHRVEDLARQRSNLQGAGARIERDAYLAHVDGLVFGADRRRGYITGRRLVVPVHGYQFTFPEGWAVSRDGAAVRAVSPRRDATVELTPTDQPTADSAARYFFARIAKSRGPTTAEQVNGMTVVSGPFSVLPLALKYRGSVRLIEFRGRVYRVTGYTKDDLWAGYSGMVDSTLATFEPVPDAEVRSAQPLHVAIVPLREPTSLAALGKARPTPVPTVEMAGINQVAADSVLPAGHVVKWVVGPMLQ